MRVLTQREKLLLRILAIITAAALIYTFIISPIMTSLSDSKKSSGNEADIRKMERLADEYKRIRLEKTRIRAILESSTENTATLIQQYAATSNIDKNIAYTKRSQSNIQNKYVKVTTEVKIDAAAMQNVLKFVNEIENSNDLLRIQYLRIKRALKGSDTYDIILKIDSFTSGK